MGYLFSVWTVIIAVGMNLAVYPFPRIMPYLLRMYPPFGFCRYYSIKAIQINKTFFFE